MVEVSILSNTGSTEMVCCMTMTSRDSGVCVCVCVYVCVCV